MLPPTPTQHCFVSVKLQSIISFLMFWIISKLLSTIKIEIGANLAIKLKKNYAETVTSNGAIWDEFSEQHLHKIIKKNTIFNARLPSFFFLNANKFKI